MPENREPTPALVARWCDGQAVVNLRGQPDNAAFLVASRAALGADLPIEPCHTVDAGGLRIVWAGPDDWFVIGGAGQADALAGRLRSATSGLHASVTDVSSGYTVLQLSGPPVREVLAQGCPLDLHPRSFGSGQCAGSHFFKASVWLWQGLAATTFEMLVRRSFRGYVEEMLQRATRESGLVWRSGAPGAVHGQGAETHEPSPPNGWR